MITNPEAHRVAEITTIAYEVRLHVLTRFFTHTDESDEQLGLLISAAFELMGDIIRPLGHALTQLPIGSTSDRPNAGFAFEMHYLMGNLVPWREPAWALLRERMAFLAEKCVSDPVLRPRRRRDGRSTGRQARRTHTGGAALRLRTHRARQGAAGKASGSSPGPIDSRHP